MLVSMLLFLGFSAKAQFCIPPAPYVPEMYNITHVVLGDIDHVSLDYNDSGYQDFTMESTPLERGGTYTITIRGYSNPDQPLTFAAWIDYNQDSVFDNWDAERLGQLLDTVGEPGGGGLEYFEVGIPFTVPSGILLGSTRLRVRDALWLANNLGPCAPSYGETEDYTVEIVLPTIVHERSAIKMNVFPNPTGGDITINGADLDGKVEIELTDLSGRVVFTELETMTANQSLTLPLAGKLAPGSYTLRVTNANGISSRPLMVQ